MSAVLICKWTLSHYDDNNDDVSFGFCLTGLFFRSYSSR